MSGEPFEAGKILGRDYRLAKKPMQFVEALNGIPFFARNSLALFAYMNFMATPAELFVRTCSAANSAIMSHAL
jgi:hypothetical protein